MPARRRLTSIHIQPIPVSFKSSWPGLHHLSTPCLVRVAGVLHDLLGAPEVIYSWVFSYPLAFTITVLFPSPLHYDSPPSIPGGVIVSRFYCRGAFSHPSREETWAHISRRIWNRCRHHEKQVRLSPLFALKTPEHCRYPNDQSGLFMLSSVNPHSTSTAIYRTTTPVTWVSFRSVHRGFNTPYGLMLPSQNLI